MAGGINGRPALFRGKDRTRGLKCYLTAIGHAKVAAAKIRVARLVGWKVADVSEGDTLEFLARGEADSVAYWKKAGLIP